MKKKNLLLTAIAIFGLATITMAQVPSYVPTTGLVGWWPFTGNAIDESVNTNDGVVTGATLTTDRFSNVNQAYSFNGSSNYIDVNDAPALRLFNSSYSISLWVYFNSFVGQDLISKRGLANIGWDLTTTSNKLGMWCGGSISYSNIVTSSSWHHVVLTYNDSTQDLKYYIDGTFDTLISSVLPASSHTANIRFGGDILLSTYWHNGKLDDIGIWNRALTPQEITDLYNGCQLSVTTQPINQSVNISNNAQFTTTSSDPLAAYQWQTDLGVGFQNLNNVGQYSGTINDTLTIANTTLSNNNQPFRCIISSGSCTDTSNVAVLTVNNNTGINEVSQSNLFSVYPNPANSQINVKADAKLLGSIYTVYDNIGKLVLTGKINSENTVIELGNLSGGIYLFSVGENLKQTFKVIKE
jgi:hypothetical protein